MPELPEVETTVRGLARFLNGARIERVTLKRPDLRRPFPNDLVQILTGSTVKNLSRRAKYGLINTNRDHTMVFHLGMSGRWRIDPGELNKHDHLILETKNNLFALCDPRRFGSIDLIPTTNLQTWRPFAIMGPEPLGDEFSPAYLKNSLCGRKQAIKMCLLDQKIVAGLGNIYVCEALWRAGINPMKPGGKITLPKLEKLVTAIKDILSQAILDGGSSLRDYAAPNGELGYFSTKFDVYGRDGEPCRTQDKGIIRRTVQGGRSTWYCNRCQK